MHILKQQLVFDFGHVVRVYRTFCPVLYYVVSPFSDPVQFNDSNDAYIYAYSLFCERCGFDELL